MIITLSLQTQFEPKVKLKNEHSDIMTEEHLTCMYNLHKYVKPDDHRPNVKNVH